jgi:hypothetical protein
MSKTEPKTWATRDGREIPLDQMFVQHIQNARRSIKDWAKGEEDPELRRELRDWMKTFGKELRKRQKQWLEKRNARTRD